MGGFGRRSGGQGGLGGRGGIDGFAGRFAAMLPNPAAEVLALKDSLALTDEEVAKLQPVRDSLAAHLSALADSIQQALGRAGSASEPSQMLGIMRPRFDEGR